MFLLKQKPTKSRSEGIKIASKFRTWKDEPWISKKNFLTWKNIKKELEFLNKSILKSSMSWSWSTVCMLSDVLDNRDTSHYSVYIPPRRNFLISKLRKGSLFSLCSILLGHFSHKRSLTSFYGLTCSEYGDNSQTTFWHTTVQQFKRNERKVCVIN